MKNKSKTRWNRIPSRETISKKIKNKWTSIPSSYKEIGGELVITALIIGIFPAKFPWVKVVSVFAVGNNLIGGGKHILACGLSLVPMRHRKIPPRVAYTSMDEIQSASSLGRNFIMRLHDPKPMNPNLRILQEQFYLNQVLPALRGGWTYHGVVIVIAKIGAQVTVGMGLSSLGIGGLGGYIIQYGITGLMESILSAGWSSLVSNAFSVEPKINQKNIAFTKEAILKLKIPNNPRCSELFGVKINNTNVVLALRPSQIAKKITKHGSVFKCGKNLTATGHNILVCACSGTLYNATFGANYVPTQPTEQALVSLITNETFIDPSLGLGLCSKTLENLTTTFIGDLRGAILNANITLASNQTAVTAVTAASNSGFKVFVLRTWYIINPSQVVKLIQGFLQ